MKFQEISVKSVEDERGILSVIENNKDIDFKIERIFYLHAMQREQIRGQHANRDSKFLLISVAGKCKVKADDGINQEIFILDNPQKGLILEPLVWKSMYDFSEDNVLLVLSNKRYDKGEYVYSYDEFLKLVGVKND